MLDPETDSVKVTPILSPFRVRRKSVRREGVEM
jgi:hypothetical protein